LYSKIEATTPFPTFSLTRLLRLFRLAVWRPKEKGESLWIPYQLKVPWILSVILIMLVVSVVLEIGYLLNKKSSRWKQPPGLENELHVVWTALPGMASQLREEFIHCTPLYHI
jgi:hypothetical protein